MIKKIYEARCDKCNHLINYYNHYKPTVKILREDFGKVRIVNGKIILICKYCMEKINGK